jgi:hypothetical protein
MFLQIIKTYQEFRLSTDVIIGNHLPLDFTFWRARPGASAKGDCSDGKRGTGEKIPAQYSRSRIIIHTPLLYGFSCLASDAMHERRVTQAKIG